MSDANNSPAEHQEIAEVREKLNRTETLVRRLGYVVFFGGALLMAVPMIIGAVQGIQQDRIWDPFTGEPVAADEVKVECVDEAVYLTRHAEFGGEWERRFRRWRQRCSDEYPDLYGMLNRVRDQLREGEEPGEIEGIDGVEPR